MSMRASVMAVGAAIAVMTLGCAPKPAATPQAAVNDKVYAVTPSEHSRLIGYAFDGYPIYGPYGYVNAEGTGGIKKISSSYGLRNITQRTTLPDGSTAMTSVAARPTDSAACSTTGNGEALTMRTARPWLLAHSRTRTLSRCNRGATGCAVSTSATKAVTSS